MIVSLLIWDIPHIPAIERRLGETIVQCRSKEEAMRMLPEAEAVIVMGGGGLQLDEDMLKVSVKLKLVLSVSAGMEKMPLGLLHTRNIAVCNTKGAHATSIAEFVLCGMLTAAHHFQKFYRQQVSRFWETDFAGDDISGKTLLIVGAGSIGREIAKKAKAFDMAVHGTKRSPEPIEDFDSVWPSDQLHKALPLADYVVLAVPLTADTHHLMGETEFSCMKPSAVFLNISRGDTVDENALIAALQNKTIAGAVLDVFHTEPLPKDSPFWTMENVIVTPHSAGTTLSAEQKTIDLVCEIITRLRQGQPLLNQVEKGSAY